MKLNFFFEVLKNRTSFMCMKFHFVYECVNYYLSNIFFYLRCFNRKQTKSCAFVYQKTLFIFYINLIYIMSKRSLSDIWFFFQEIILFVFLRCTLYALSNFSIQTSNNSRFFFFNCVNPTVRKSRQQSQIALKLMCKATSKTVNDERTVNKQWTDSQQTLKLESRRFQVLYWHK